MGSRFLGGWLELGWVKTNLDKAYDTKGKMSLHDNQAWGCCFAALIVNQNFVVGFTAEDMTEGRSV